MTYDPTIVTHRADQHDKIIVEIRAEIIRQDRKHGASFPRLHDAYFAIVDEVEKVYIITAQERNKRSKVILRRALIRVAALAIKGVLSIDNFVA